MIVETPVNLTKQQKDLLKSFGDSLAGNDTEHSPRATSWLDGVKKFFEHLLTALSFILFRWLVTIVKIVYWFSVNWKNAGWSFTPVASKVLTPVRIW